MTAEPQSGLRQLLCATLMPRILCALRCLRPERLRTGYDWDSDYLHRLHLVTADNNNDPEASGRRAELSICADGPYRWTAYVPEYRNLKADSTPAPRRGLYRNKTVVAGPGRKAVQNLFLNIFGAKPLPIRHSRGLILNATISTDSMCRYILAKLQFYTSWNYRPQPEINA